jgi:hypothetical protein
MLEEKGDLFSSDNEVIVIPTNGEINNKRCLLMDSGIAELAKIKWPELPKSLGRQVDKFGNYAFAHKTDDGTIIISLPIKNRSYNKPDVQMIASGCRRIVETADQHDFQKIYMPRPGCGKDELSWDEVKPHIADVLDDRFVIITHDRISMMREENNIEYREYF